MTAAGISTGVAVWWMALCLVGVLNLCVWLAVATGSNRRLVGLGSSGVTAERRWPLLLSGIFVLGCAFRSVFPFAEGQRFCLYVSVYGSWISSAVIARAVATVAELCFVAECALLLREYGRAAGARFAATAALFLVPLIATAEVFSWYTALTTNFIGSVFEESIWAVTGALLAIAFASVLRHYRGGRRRFIGTAVALTATYVAFMCAVDVPMYWSRRQADDAAGRTYFSLADGWEDGAHRRVVTGRWEDWRHEVPWMSLYFSAGVWISIGLTQAPLASGALVEERRARERERRRVAI
jgi:hypothetical protein